MKAEQLTGRNDSFIHSNSVGGELCGYHEPSENKQIPNQFKPEFSLDARMAKLSLLYIWDILKIQDDSINEARAFALQDQSRTTDDRTFRRSLIDKVTITLKRLDNT